MVAVTGHIPTAAVLDVPLLPGEDVPDVLPLPALILFMASIFIISNIQYYNIITIYIC